jgi:protein NrfD
MSGVPSSTYFSAPPDWGWLIVLYFFFGGLAGGSYFLASLIDLFGRSEDRPLSHLGYSISFPCVAIGGLLLTVDLKRPERFWHMLIESNTYRPMFKHWSPMSLGSWALMIFGIFAFVAFLGALAEAGRIPWPAWRKVHPPSLLGRFIAVIGGIFGFYVAGYTGVLLAVTNRPIWSDTPLLGLLFIVSAASTSAALMILLANKSGWTMRGLQDLRRMDAWLIVLELIVLIAVVVSLGPVVRAWLNVWGLLLLFSVIGLGRLVPLALYWQGREHAEHKITTTAVLVLAGGFILRLVIVFSAQGV